jgi:hypothetical protein
MDKIHPPTPVVLLREAIDGHPKDGRVGLIAATAGTGKSALLVHVALDVLLGGGRVLHVALRETVDHARAHYDHVLRAMAPDWGVVDRADTLLAVERNRMIHSHLDGHFDADGVVRHLDMLRDAAQFKPTMIVIDGFDAAGLNQHLPAIAAMAGAREVPIWVTCRGEADEAWSHVDIALQLQPEGRWLNLTKSTREGREVLEIALNPKTMLVVGFTEQITDVGEATSRPGDCTLFSGGARGSECAFGEEAGRWGVKETTFTFEGHRQDRNVGNQKLTEAELAAGDVSLVYVSRRLNRKYRAEGGLIRRVLQTLWHMVSRSQQVFVVGAIQEDGTVHGGTGWSVELARMWNKELWVYDQERRAWHRWDGNDWVPGTPLITSRQFSGTGTRYLTDDGRMAVVDLFERSFGHFG